LRTALEMLVGTARCAFAHPTVLSFVCTATKY
jgi:hypothetical protein